jgi:predicted DNA-binding ribbon-helix-helix protein
MSLIKKHTVVISGRNTSLTLEDEFWQAVKVIAAAERMTIRDLVAGIDTRRDHKNLSSAVRVFVLDYYQRNGWRRLMTSAPPAA